MPRSGGASGSAESPAGSLEQLVASKEIIITCGSGGVGKTTTAAAIGAMAASTIGGKVLVLTVDPAKRLANALGLERFGNAERRVPDDLFTAAGVLPRGELWAAMLDTKESWDALVRAHAPDVETRDAILSNPLYQNITSKFVQSHDYIAMERLYELHSSGRYDLIIVDTPPTRNAIDFLEAPERMAEFFSSRLLRWLITPYRSRFVNAASRPFYNIADRILGSQFLQDIADFFILFQTMYDGFVERADAVTRTLSDRRTTFVVVSTLEQAPAREAEFFITELDARGFPLGALVLNKVLPGYLLDGEAAESAEVLCRKAAQIAAEVAPNLRTSPPDAQQPDAQQPDAKQPDAKQVERVLVEVGSNFSNYRVIAAREAEQRKQLSQVPEVTAVAPFFDRDIFDLAGLLRLGDSIWR